MQEREAKLQNWQSSLEFKEASLDSLRSVMACHRACSVCTALAPISTGFVLSVGDREVMDVRQRDIRETLLYGTWWHSTIPSLDPVGLTWQKQSAAEMDAEEVI